MVTVESSTVNTAETLHEIHVKGSLAELKQEQEEAVVSLLVSRDALALLPAGFEKNLIFQVFVSSWSQIKKRLAKWRRYPSEDSCDLPAGWSH